MIKVLITKKAYKYLKAYYGQICFDLFEGFCMDLIDVKPVRNKIGWIKYYRCSIEASESNQKEVVNAFKWLGLIPY